MTRRQRRPCRSWCLFRFGWPERQGRLRDGGGVHAFAQYAPCLYENVRIANTRKDNVYFRGKIVAMPTRRPTPTLRLRRLAAELRRLRADAGLTREEVGGRTGINEATLYRLEVAKARPRHSLTTSACSSQDCSRPRTTPGRRSNAACPMPPRKRLGGRSRLG